MDPPPARPSPARRHSAGPRWLGWAQLAVWLGGALFSAVVGLEVTRQLPYVREHFERSWPLTLGLVALGGPAGAYLALRALRGRPAFAGSLPALFPLRLLFVVGLGAAGVYLATSQPFHLLFALVYFAAGFGAYVLLLAVASAAARGGTPRWLRVLDFGLFNLALALLLLELGLRGIGRFARVPLLQQSDLAAANLIDINRFPAGDVRFGFPLDSRGYYDLELDPANRAPRLVVSIGDSFSQGVVPHPHHFTTVCERELEGVEVYNMGVVSVGPPEYRYLLEHEALPLRPDLVLVNLYVGNDVDCPGQRAERHRALRLWLARENLLLLQLPLRLSRLAEERRRSGGARGAQAGGAALEPGTAATAAALEERFPWLADPLLEEPQFSEERYFGIVLKRARDAWDAESSDFRGLFESLAAIRETAGATPLAFVLIPDELQVEDALWERIRTRLADRPLERDLPQRVIGTWLAERGVPYLDLLPALLAEPPLEDGARHLYHLRDTHFNARGNRVAGRALAEFVRGLLGS